MNIVIRSMERSSQDIWTAQVEIGPYVFPVLVEVTRSAEFEGFNFRGSNGDFVEHLAMFHGFGMEFNRDFWPLDAGGGRPFPWIYSDFEQDTLDRYIAQFGTPRVTESPENEHQ